MTGYLRRISTAEVLQLQAKPAYIKQLLRPPYDREAAIRDQIKGKTSAKRSAMEAAMARSRQIAEEIRNTRVTSGPGTAEEYQRIMKPLKDAGAFGDETKVLNLEKSWHTLHYLLTGTAEPINSGLGRAILGGKEIGPDLGYGPARLLTSAEVRDVAAALTNVSTEDLAKRFDLATMKAAEIYACRDTDELELAQTYLVRVTEFYSVALAAGDAMLLYLK